MKIICLGRNYRKGTELRDNTVEQPVVFLKPDTALLRNNSPFYIPDWAERFDYEVEVVYRISRLGRHIDPKFAHRYYDAVGLGIDFTAQDLQTSLSRAGNPWEISKAFDYSAAISQFIPKELLPDILRFSLDINGERRQEGQTSDMIWGIDQTIAYVSKFFSLRMGDLIFTGTPIGSGPVHEGDRLTAELEGRQLFDFLIK